ncbi:phenylalanine--tRNA ligase subunit beta [Candidatus Pelagibacter giovannonii]|uniref:Phenylalanine--tRNA ligase beta subunit n=1 Tax=Candidatus Pelagibacter giovannonii TaxID=2563896 RepID=A0A6H1Q381_9PROT|nr:phenylalanine--tRNA ligase subunit beta [Candidatus Pelagibacter giovannonii]QIZ20960.1 phenylalanine--tRNA ligase subunit beta [Candidatus Pelagibacter giovannonii]
MKITTNWLKEHLETELNENQIIDKLTDVGLEVEGVDSQSGELDEFVIAKILKTEKHPDADRLRVCDVDIGSDNPVKVVCGAPNAKKGLMTIYAPPGAIVPKNQMKLVVSKIRGVTSYGMLCSESELNLSDESDGITELSSKKYEKKIGENYFPKSSVNVIDISITPNRADCLGVRGIARDLATAGSGTLKKFKTEKLVQKNKQKVSIKIIKEKNQGCTSFGSCLITGVKNTESPDWLKKRIISLGQKPISAIVDITNYVMIDLNRPLHAYDADKIDKGIIVRNSKKGEKFKALDEKDYNLEDDMCVITDASGVLGLGGIIGGTRSGTELDTKNVLIESAYFNPRSIRKTSKILNIDTDAKFRFERGIDPLSIEQGLQRAAELIKKICGGEISKFDIQKIENVKDRFIKFDMQLFEKITGFKIDQKETIKILTNLGFEIKKQKKLLLLKVPTWRPDILQEVDIVEELVRIKGYDQIKVIEPEKVRNKDTLNKTQKLFHFLQRAIASKGYLEAITWSFTDSKINQLFIESNKEIKIVNPISADLNVLRSSIFSNLIININKNLGRGFKDLSIFEIGPTFSGSKPGEQQTVVSGLRTGKLSRQSWIEQGRLVDIFDVKRDVIQSLVEAGYNKDKLYIDDETPSYYHPGKSGRIFLNKGKEKVAGFFGDIHPNILKELDIKAESLVGFEIFLDNIKQPKKLLKNQKTQYKYSDFQKSERDFAFVLDKNFKAQELIEIIRNVDKELIKSVKVFDVYEGENIDENKKSIALNVTIQSLEKTLKEEDLNKINQLIISTVESKTDAKIRS